MEEPTCGNCAHFRQHYIPWHDGIYHKIPCGHCVYPRLKHRSPETFACVYFKPAPSDEQEDSND